MSLGWFIDDTIMELFMNTEHEEKSKSKIGTFFCKKGPLKTIRVKEPPMIVYKQYVHTTTFKK